MKSVAVAYLAAFSALTCSVRDISTPFLCLPRKKVAPSGFQSAPYDDQVTVSDTFVFSAPRTRTAPNNAFGCLTGGRVGCSAGYVMFASGLLGRTRIVGSST